MSSKNTKKKVTQFKIYEPLNRLETCKVSKASVEIMLERFCNGEKIDFPFS